MSTDPGDGRATAVQVPATVLAAEPAGAYRRLVLSAPTVAAVARPGQFLALAVGDPPTATLLRRAFSLYRADPADGTVQIVVAGQGVGSSWVERRRSGDTLDVVGPLGTPFPLPGVSLPRSGGRPGRCVLVGGGYGSAPLLWLAQLLRARGQWVDLVLGAATAERLFGAEAGREVADVVHLTTDDGSAGTAGRVTDVLGGLLTARTDPAATQVYACGPMAMLAAVAAAAAAVGARSWCAVEESMACGIGVCMTCVLPVRGSDGMTRMTRSCVDGPTFAGDAVRWDAVDPGPHGAVRVPDDCLGAPVGAPGRH